MLRTLMALVASLVLALPAAPRAAPGLRRLRFGELTPGIQSLILTIGSERGLFARRGLAVDVLHFSGGPSAITAAAAGEIDLGSAGTPVLIGAARGVPIRIVSSPAATQNPFILVGGRGIQRIEDLRGRRVGVSSLGGGNRQALAYIAGARRLLLDDFRLVGLSGGGGASYSALQAGHVDAVVTSDPWASKIELDGVGRVLAAAADHFGRYQHSFLFASQRLLDREPEAVRGFLAAYREAVAYLKGHPDELVARAARELQLDDRLLRRVLARELPTWNETGKVDLEGTRNAVRILKEIGELDAPLLADVLQIIDPRFGAL